MSRNSMRNAHASGSAIRTSLLAAESSSKGVFKKNQLHLEQTRKADVDGKVRKTANADDSGGSLTGTSSSNGEADGEISDASSAETDEAADEDEDGDAIAPSDLAVKVHGNQAGLSGKDFIDVKPIVTNRNDEGAFSLKEHVAAHNESMNSTTLDQVEALESDDGGYDGVDDILDSDEYEPKVERVEEQNIIDSEESHDIRRPRARRWSDSDSWEGLDLDDGSFCTDVHHFDDQYASTEPTLLGIGTDLFGSNSIFSSFGPDPQSSSFSQSSPPRRVHFKSDGISPPRSDSSDVVSDDEGLSMLFEQQGRHRRVDEAVATNGHRANQDDDQNSVGSHSGYETDYGDTTDDEVAPVPPSTLPKQGSVQPQSLLLQPSLSLLNTAAETISPAPPTSRSPKAPAGHRRGPRLGTWKASLVKPSVMIDNTGDNLLVVYGKRSVKNASTCPTCPASPVAGQSEAPLGGNDSHVEQGDIPSHVTADPMLASAPDMLTSGLFPSATRSQAASQASASLPDFCPENNIGDYGVLYGLGDEDDENDDDDEAVYEQFINFDESSSDEDGNREDMALGGTSLPTPLSTSPTCKAAQASAKATASGDSLVDIYANHHDVGAFRRGQSYNQQQSRYHHTKTAFRHFPGKPSLGTQKKRKLSTSLSSGALFGAAAKKRLIHN